VLNFLSSNWGRAYYVPNGQYSLLRFEGYRNAAARDYTPIYSFAAPTDSPWAIDDFLSRWRMQFGVRYLLN
jgi:hypothetical protein